jgi:hypothetical protein
VAKNLAAGFMTNVWPALKQVWSMVAANLQPAIKELGTYWTGTVVPMFKAAWPSIQKVAVGLGVLVAAVVVVVSWLVGKLMPAVTLISKVILSLGKDIVDFVATGILRFQLFVVFMQSLSGKITAAVSGLWDGLKYGFKAALNWIIDRWNSFPKMNIPGIDVGPVHYGGGTIGLPNLPHLAGGGVVPATRGGRLIVAGEGGEDEIVAPEGKLRSMLAGAGGITVNINAPGATPGTVEQLRAIGRETAREVVYEIAREVSY